MRANATTTTQPPAAATARALLISIQPRFANAILSGTKTIELRRTMPTLEPDALALIYSSAPTKALVGWARVKDIVSATPNTLWNEHKGAAGVTASEFHAYFAGRPHAYGLRLAHVESAYMPVTLEELREHDLQPPQSWRYVSGELARRLVNQMARQSIVDRGHGDSATAIA